MKKFLLLILLFSAFGCSKPGNNNETPGNAVNPHVQSLHEEVMKYHDEVMPHLGEVISLKGELETAADTLSEELARQSLSAAEQLGVAEEGMMGWMRQFDNQLSAEDTTMAIRYYEDQLMKVKEMSEQFAGALREGRELKSELSGE